MTLHLATSVNKAMGALVRAGAHTHSVCVCVRSRRVWGVCACQLFGRQLRTTLGVLDLQPPLPPRKQHT